VRTREGHLKMLTDGRGKQNPTHAVHRFPADPDGGLQASAPHRNGLWRFVGRPARVAHLGRQRRALYCMLHRRRGEQEQQGEQPHAGG
jgi:hypothetical protein